MKRNALLLAAFSTLLFVTCQPGTTGGPAPAERDSPTEDLSSAPTSTPYTAKPRIKNGAIVTRAIESEYPRTLRDQGIGGIVTVWLFVDEEGNVVRTLVNESSGYRTLDDAALRLANMLEVTPAVNRGKRVPVWISLPFTFSTRQ